ncbi:MAG: putative adenylate kinase [Linnemannia gamsii]|nr:MAG: putative adenylate kinase [Linnemannia gamsii]
MKKKTNVGQAPALAAAAQEESMNESVASMTEKHEKRFAKYTIGSQIKGAKLIFDQAFKHENIKFPKQIIWLIGAPGSGKGIHTPAILRTRGITHSSISMPSLLTAPKCKELINKGMIVSDGKLVENLWHALLDCEPEVGVLVDGFPRSEVQVECLKLFHERMHELRKEYKHTPIKVNFPRPTLQICVLYVDEEISINHQLMRRKLIKEHNAKVMRSGKGEFMEERVTDFDEIPSPFLLAHAELIIWIFKDHYPCLLKLSKIFPFHIINAVGSIDSVMRIILKEFQYHSSVGAGPTTTYEASPTSHSPPRWTPCARLGNIMTDLVGTLSGGLEHYCVTAEIFSKTVRLIDQEVSPILLAHSISGQALVRSNTILPTPSLWRSSSVF